MSAPLVRLDDIWHIKRRLSFSSCLRKMCPLNLYQIAHIRLDRPSEWCPDTSSDKANFGASLTSLERTQGDAFPLWLAVQRNSSTKQHVSGWLYAHPPALPCNPRYGPKALHRRVLASNRGVETWPTTVYPFQVGLSSLSNTAVGNSSVITVSTSLAIQSESALLHSRPVRRQQNENVAQLLHLQGVTAINRDIFGTWLSQ